MGNKGILLIMVLGTIFIVTILATIALNIVTSQGKFTYHQVTRTQAYYAAMAGINLAREKIRLGDPNWPAPTAVAYTRYLCRSDCTGTGDFNDGELPLSLIRVEITVGGPDADDVGPNSTRKITARATYNPPAD